MHVIFVASEAVPFAKTGGLADVIGALPRALERQGHTTAVFLPAYRCVQAAGESITRTGINLAIPVGSELIEGSVYTSVPSGSNVPFYLIDQPRYFDRDGIYGEGGADYADNAERFIFFNLAVLAAIQSLDIRPDVIHCNDWQTGLVPAYVKTRYERVPALAAAGSLLTIHNMAYLGLFPRCAVGLTGLDWSLFNWRQLEFRGGLCFLKAGLVFADMLNAVSPTYAKEIQTPAFGSGLDGLLRYRQADLWGIVNGIDTDLWSPSREPALIQRYDAATVFQGKPVCKAWLQKRAGLAERPEVPLFAQIGRLDRQKGWDLLAEVADRLLERDVQVVVLGEGRPEYHALLADLGRRYPHKFWAHLGFCDELAHQIEAGADISLMPSRFEPCGLNQLYSLAHGTVPVVRATGGLADTVVDVTAQTLADSTATGFVFIEPTATALWQAIERALSHWADRQSWLGLVQSGMRADWSWGRSASAYLRLYEEVRRRARSRKSRADGSDPPSRCTAGWESP
jgi:starch synthase